MKLLTKEEFENLTDKELESLISWSGNSYTIFYESVSIIGISAKEDTGFIIINGENRETTGEALESIRVGKLNYELNKHHIKGVENNIKIDELSSLLYTEVSQKLQKEITDKFEEHTSDLLNKLRKNYTTPMDNLKRQMDDLTKIDLIKLSKSVETLDEFARMFNSVMKD